MRRFTTLITLVLLIAHPLFIVDAQQGNQFEIGVFVQGPDTTAPSVPTGLTANAVSQTQIDLSWTASTDNVAVTGYNIFRDAGFIASTTGTSFSDTGLTAATTYAYTVSAFDAADNESARSATTSETTQSGSGSSSGGSNPTPQFTGITETVSTSTATVAWGTDIPTTAVFRWGLTTSYEIGSIVKSTLETSDSVDLTGLSDDTTYYYELTVTSDQGQNNVATDQFTTDALPDTTPPANPVDFFATSTPSDDIQLTWTNPPDPDFQEVRIMRSTIFYPVDIFDGSLEYEGSAQSHLDTDVVLDTQYYYTLFARDTTGNYSSGAIATAIVTSSSGGSSSSSGGSTTSSSGSTSSGGTTSGGGGTTSSGGSTTSSGTSGSSTGTGSTTSSTTGGGTTSSTSGGGTTTPTIDIPIIPTDDPIIDDIDIPDFDFGQDGDGGGDGDGIIIDASKNLTISVDYDDLPEVLKTITVTIQHPTDPEKTFSFLLRTGLDQTNYSATIAPLKDPGEYAFTITIVDFKNQGLKKLDGTFLVVDTSQTTVNQTRENSFLGFITSNFWLLLVFLIIPLLLLLLLLLLLKRRKEEQKDEDLYVVVEGWDEKIDAAALLGNEKGAQANAAIIAGATKKKPIITPYVCLLDTELTAAPKQTKKKSAKKTHPNDSPGRKTTAAKKSSKTKTKSTKHKTKKS